MKALRFKLSGQLACFRRPDVNTEVYFTYNNIHKVALLGLLGAIIGLKGYRNGKLHGEASRNYPEFYGVLSPLSVSIVPNGKNGYFTKKIQYFNNSVGYASSEKGGNLQVREQWLENPSWTILLLQNGLDNLVWDKLCNFLQSGQCTYIPYLGRNDFPAEISGVEIIELSPTCASRLNSLFPFDYELKCLSNHAGKYLFLETAPYALAPVHNFYEYRRFAFTDSPIAQDLMPTDVYTDGTNNYCFS